jgi:outer membrane biosynthesis protein TonB
MLRISIFLIAMVSLLIFSVSNATEVILKDTPNVGDTTTITTVTTGNPVTTNNLLSQNWIDGSWIGTMFPDSSDINENTWLTGKDGKYAETTLNSEDYVTIDELQQGFTSTFGAQIRWWNHVESTVTMTQTITDGIDTTTQSTTFEDTTNSSYQVNPYGNTLVMSPDPDMTHGTATYRFDFNIQGNKNFNGGHAGVDVRDPTAVIDYTALSSTTVTTVEYCWQKNPPTCPGQDEIEDVQEQLEQFELMEFIIPEDIFLAPPPEIEYTFNPVVEEIDIVEEFEIMPMDEFFFEPEYIEEVFVEEFIPVDVVMVEDIEMFEELPPMEFFDELPSLEMFEELPPMEEVYMEEIVMEEMFVEEFTEEMQEEFIEEVFEEVIVETEPEPAPEPEPVEEVAMVEEKPAMEEVKEEPIEEEIVSEEVTEQPSSEEVVADEPAPAAEIAQQEEAIEEPTQEQPSSDVEVDLDIKVAAIEKAIQSKIKNEMQRVSVTLDVINEVVSREMTATQADISSYFDTNAALFDSRQLPSGNPAFFVQASLESYDKTIYARQVSIAGTDPVVQHQIKVQNARKKTSDAYRNLMELLNARNVQ